MNEAAYGCFGCKQQGYNFAPPEAGKFQDDESWRVFVYIGVAALGFWLLGPLFIPEKYWKYLGYPK